MWFVKMAYASTWDEKKDSPKMTVAQNPGTPVELVDFTHFLGRCGIRPTTLLQTDRQVFNSDQVLVM